MCVRGKEGDLLGARGRWFLIAGRWLVDMLYTLDLTCRSGARGNGERETQAKVFREERNQTAQLMFHMEMGYGHLFQLLLLICRWGEGRDGLMLMAAQGEREREREAGTLA